MRAEFTKGTKRLALARAKGLCEASGSFYGLEGEKICAAPLGYGVEFDHYVLDANSKDASLSNCRAVCPKCHRWKTSHVDIPTAAKTVRQQDKNLGIKGKRQAHPMRRSSLWKRKVDGSVVPR